MSPARFHCATTLFIYVTKPPKLICTKKFILNHLKRADIPQAYWADIL
ncbi:unnamed protein product [Debaryomyces tyrocola]|nr:unnamed protein product [Debaryomyces tyrocola]